MTATGIICEYNPFHFGHLYQLEELRRTFPEDVIICCMSGNFVQRADYAVFPKMIRASAAVACGADLVIELPTPWVLSSAPGFASAGVFMLRSVGCTRLSFGSECGSLENLYDCVDFLSGAAFRQALKRKLSAGLSFPSAREAAARELGFQNIGLLSSPNDILGISYLQAIRDQGADMAPLPVKRVGTDHDSGNTNGIFSSASLLRERLHAHPDRVPEGIPEKAARIYEKAIRDGLGPVFPDSQVIAHMAVLRRLTLSALSSLPDMREGFERRLYRSIAAGSSPEEIADLAKTKRYTHARIRRQLLCAYLGIHEEDQKGLPSYGQVLCFNDRGRAYLSGIRDISFPLLIKPARHGLSGKAAELFERSILWDDLYMLACPGKENRIGGSAMRTTPGYIRDRE